MSLKNLQGKLSRSEMKNIMGGDAPGGGKVCTHESCSGDCDLPNDVKGQCHVPSSGTNEGKCFCTGSY